MPTRDAPLSFLTPHAHVLLIITNEPTLRLREIAERVGLTDRAVQRLVTDLEEAGYITREKDGRRNVYSVDTRRRLEHPLESHATVASLLEIVQR